MKRLESILEKMPALSSASKIFCISLMTLVGFRARENHINMLLYSCLYEKIKINLKHKISFWHHLKDRLLDGNTIPSLPDLILATTCG
ncbi:MAG: hypothetical protein K9L60_08170 [Methylovulum sp.]|jgi:hypothetical protein|nr:hypothetical protein [Methylovulum sp.]MCF7999167.1 hypothetical protein [Methylovulum sp.]